MTDLIDEDRRALDSRLARSRGMERAEVREAIAMSSARSNINRMLGEELIAAGREVVAAYRERRNSENRMANAIAALEKLVGTP